ncbi:hypothetical protein ABXS75_13295 [Roseburia hominis]
MSKEIAMQAKVDVVQLKELENISLFLREPALKRSVGSAFGYFAL